MDCSYGPVGRALNIRRTVGLKKNRKGSGEDLDDLVCLLNHDRLTYLLLFYNFTVKDLVSKRHFQC